MGIPTYTRWLCRKYPLILKSLSDPDSPAQRDGNTSSQQQQQQQQQQPPVFDNFYIDMNGIIHDCAHGQILGSTPRNTDDVLENLQNYLDRLITAVNPRKLLFMSVDGVAPKAKVKEQRGRRFRSGYESVEIKQLEEQLKKEMIAEGFQFPPDVEEEEEESFNSLNIFPGTDFMSELQVFLDYYVTKTLQSNEKLQNLNVLISDSDVPGEGEHKIMEFIRSQRTQPDYLPNQTHIIHGLDADLSMLALSSHEPLFYILVEQLFITRCAICGAPDHSTRECVKLPRKKLGASTKDDKFYHRPLQVISIKTLRDYLDLEMRPVASQMKIPYNLERIIDDYVFLCIFVGNDFLPSLPLFDIREGAVTMLLNLYRRLLPTWTDYIIRPGGEINYLQVQSLMREVYANEGNILRRKRLFGRYTVGRLKRPAVQASSTKPPELGDEESVDYGKPGWSDAYYRQKFGLDPSDRVSIERVCQEYMLGLAWIMRYYCTGCASWDWFYPEHYAPLLRDLSAMNNVTVSFSLGQPISKLEAVIAVGFACSEPRRRARRSTPSSRPSWSSWSPRRTPSSTSTTRSSS
ncbi:uncharacterized protein [Blastocystis hominis]|uniref:Uncharacterized protein n=1 Tax=Blastocystis hominis TaxID=12968 RepID=D8LV03_BLAHO|nr:uncharacterized protein [Blastocystis hominis]CBK19642.2 unnamed protein product [Blastocystis hominis]|eukprot:XP_012893690.1 uncharacterized protein [Blastocystis hominis]